jgi:nicotinate-nucleotide--dimethylbenzimidazole phosphoribosyltransferase
VALDLPELASAVPLPDDAAQRRARSALDELAPSFGRLGELSTWLAGAQGRFPTMPLDRVRLVVFAGDHGIAQQEQSTHDTAGIVQATVRGTTTTNALAEQTGAGVRVVDVAVDADGTGLPEAVIRYKVRRGSGRVDLEDALTRAEAEAAFVAGVAVADEEVDGGADLLVIGGLGVRGDVSAATIAALLTGKDVPSVVGHGSPPDDRAWMRRCAAVRDAARRGRRVMAQGHDMIDLLATVGGADLAALTGFVVQSAVRRTPVVLDGLVTCAAAVVARQVNSRVPRWLVAGHRSPDPGQSALLDRLRLTPVVDFAIGLDDGFGALLAVPPLRAAADLPSSLGADVTAAGSTTS